MTLTGLNQLWVADITYIRLRAEFVYLAVILDAYSRRVIGWALGRTLEDTLTLRALRMALDQRRPAPELKSLGWRETLTNDEGGVAAAIETYARAEA